MPPSDGAGGAVSRAKFALGVPLALAADMVFFSVLRRARPHPVGLAVPTVRPAMLSSASHDGGQDFTSIVLCYGRPLAVAGPFTEVQTCFSERDCHLPALEETITRAKLRDDAWARQDWEREPGVFEPAIEVEVPEDGFECQERAVVVAGQERRLQVVSHDAYEALRLVHHSMVVTAVARCGLPERPAFDVVGDLEPYLAEHRRFILSWLRFWEE
jgi:hypothetical protein